MKKVYCKKNYCTISKEDISFSFINDSFYAVYFIDDVYCWIALNNGVVQAFYFDINIQPRFKDYFYTINELRKLKIFKLNSI